MNIIGLQPDRYWERWNAFLEIVEYSAITDPADQAAFWRSFTGSRELIEWPVPVEYFLTSPYYAGAGLNVRPKIMDTMRDFWSIEAREELLIFIAGIGTGKSFLGSLSLTYGLYLLSIMRDPIEWLNRFPGVSLSSGSEIVLLNSSAAGAEQGEKIVYGDTLSRITQSPYFSALFPPSPTKQSELIFPNRVRYSPGTSDWRSALGWNVFGFAIDEAAFGKETERADYVAELFKALNQRRRSRFGILGFGCLLTSPGHDASYVETLSRQGESWDTSMRVVRMNTWDSKEEIHPGAKVFLFDRHRDSMRIVERNLTYLRAGVLAREDGQALTYIGEPAPTDEDDPLPTTGHDAVGLDLMVIPRTYEAEFRRDPADSILKYGALPQRALSPWYIETANIYECAALPDLVVGSRATPRFDQQHPDAVWSAGVADPRDEQSLLLALADDLMSLRPDWRMPWHAHVDPGLNRGRKGDAGGIAVGRILDTISIQDQGVQRLVNRYVVPIALQIIAPEAGEIFLSAISKFILALRALGINITSFSYDAYQSMGSIQELTMAGLVTHGIKVDPVNGLPRGFGKPFSVDKTAAPHQELKEAVNEQRILMPDYWILKHELSGLQDVWGKAPDHPVGGSKDVADPVAGVVGYLAQHGHYVWVMPDDGVVSMTDAWEHMDSQDRQEEQVLVALDGEAGGARLVLD